MCLNLKWFGKPCPSQLVPDFLAKFPSAVFSHTGSVSCSLSICHVSQPTHLCSDGSFCLEVLPDSFYHFCVACKFLKKKKKPISDLFHKGFPAFVVLSYGICHLFHHLVVKGPRAGSGTSRAQEADWSACLPSLVYLWDLRKIT